MKQIHWIVDHTIKVGLWQSNSDQRAKITKHFKFWEETKKGRKLMVTEEHTEVRIRHCKTRK
jgi:hypothetical protein